MRNTEMWAHICFSASVGGFTYLALTGGNDLGIAAAAAGVFAFGFPSAKGMWRSVRRMKPLGVLGGGCLRLIYGCQQIFPNRKQAMPNILSALVRQVEKNGGRVVILAVSGREFLNHRVKFNSGRSVLAYLASELNRRGCQVEVTFILLNPNCKEAIRRAVIENANDTRHELKASVENYKMYFDENPRARLGLYSFRPRRFIFLTDASVFTQYYLEVPPDDWDNGCIGDLTPVECYPAGTEGYNQAQAEVDSILKSPDLAWVNSDTGIPVAMDDD
ncbi:MAG: hypothetical protein O2909_01650 [Chloroflexi bacterium]|nr:hypothetical protein [Chloroflexota bacterium]